MNKRKVDEILPLAVYVLKDKGIAKNGAIEKAYRGQISTFGAAIMNGSLLSAIAFFSDNGSSSVNRTLLMDAVYELIEPDHKYRNLFEYVMNANEINNMEVKENIVNAAIALKLAMNLYSLKGEIDE